MSYEINSEAVNSRNDWQQQPTTPGLTARSAETFPGDATVFLGVGELLPGGVVITGYLEADSIAALQAKINTEYARTAETTLSTVELNGVTYSDQHLARFDVLGPNEPYLDSGSTKHQRRVRYVWQGVKP